MEDFLDFEKINKNIEYTKQLIEELKESDEKIKNDNELTDEQRKKLLEKGKLYEVYALYDLKFYTLIKNFEFDKCFKIIKLSRNILNNFIEEIDELAGDEDGFNTEEYLDAMNGLKKKFDMLNRWEENIKFIKKYKEMM